MICFRMGKITLKVFGKYTADRMHNCISYFLWEGELFAVRVVYHSSIKAYLPLPLQIPLEDMGVEDDSDREEDVEIFIPDPNMEESHVDE